MKFEMIKILAAAVALSSLMATGTYAATMSSGQVSCEPPIVGYKLAALTVQFFTDISIPVDSIMEVTVPGEATIQPGLLTCAIAGYNDEDGLTCEGLPDEKTLVFPVLYTLRAYEQNVFKFEGAFNAPLTSDPTDSFIIKIYNNDKSQVLVEGTNGISLSLLGPNTIQSVSISQSGDSSSVVGDETQLVFSVTTLNPIPPGGGVKIEMPKWNTAAADSQRQSYLVESSSEPLCLISSGMEQISCIATITPLYDTLVVKDMFPDGRLAGDTFVFIVNQARNPLSMSPVEFTVTTFSSILSESPSVSFRGVIDQGPALLSAMLPAPIDPDSAIINSDDTTVSEQSQLIIPFKIPVPVQLDLGCTILITLPDDFNVVAGKLTIFRGWGIFQGVSELNAQVNEQQRSIKIVDQCVQYTAANQQNTIRIGQIQNPALVRPTKDFKIEIQDNNGLLIASVETGVTFTPTPGTFSTIALVPHSAQVEIQEVTDVELVFTPQHPISELGKLHIKMPEDLPAKCDISATTGGIKLPLTCSVDPDDSTIILMDPFAETAHLGNQQLTIVFRGLRLPNSQRPILGITLESYDSSDNQHFLVDKFQSLDYQFFTPQSVTFLYSNIGRNTGMTYTEAQFRIANTVATEIPIGSTMEIYVPKQITITSTVSVMSSCNAVNNMSPTMTCTIVANTDGSVDAQPDGSHTITISDAFDQMLQKNDEVVFTIKRGLVTPISTETSDSFRMTIYDGQGYEINYIRQAMTLTMQRGMGIDSMEVTPTSYRVGDQANHKVSFNTPIPLLEGFKLQVFVPQDVTTPRAADITCVGEPPLITDIQCQLNGNRITMELETLSQVSIDEQISITIGPMGNPGSTYPTEPYQLSIRSATWYECAEELAHPGGKVQMDEPSMITDYSFSVFDYRQKALTTVTINWVSTETYPKDTKIVIDYDQTQISPQITDLSETVPCIFRQSRIITCSFEYNQIFVNDIMPSEEYGNSNMELTITNMLINVVTPLETDSWQLTTYLNDGRSKIDQISSDMTLTFECNYPCLTCEPGQPDVCTACNTIEGDQILYDSKCYMQCPAGTFFQYFQCQLCDDKCKTCEYTSGTSCTSCNAGSAWPYLNGKDCSNTCNYGEFGNALTNTCESCEYPCEQCTETPNKCTSCRQDTLDKYYFDNQCLPECPLGQYVQLEARNNVCLDCSENCLTCELTADTCSSCPAGWILNHLDNSCVEECPDKVTIYQPVNATQDYESCEPCKSSCKTCEGTINWCTSCGDPLSLKRQEGRCVLECDVFFQSQVSVNNECFGCSSSCAKCQFSPDYCIKCVPGTYFYQNTCVKQCPIIDDYQFEPDEETGETCVIPGLICPFGWKVNYAGTGCELKNQVCEENYELNHDKTACVPVSTFYIPFPILIVMFLTCIAPIVSKIKRKVTLIVPNFIVFVSFFETICIIVLVAQAYIYGIVPTFYLAIVGLVFIFASNMFFTLMYTQQVRPDTAFKHWYPRHNKIAIMDMCFGILNFKMYRLLYCRLFGRDEFNAPFNEPNLFYRPFNLTSLFAIITVTLPVLVSSVIGLIYVRWGYQLYITCIEMLVIEVILVCLQITEYIQQKFKQKKYFKVTKKDVEVKVCSDFPDSDENDEYGTKKDKSKSKPKSIKAVRHLGMVVARMAGHDDFVGDQNKQVEREIEELHNEDMMHRQLRHCQSFREFRPTLDEAFSGDEGEDDRFQDFISEPASPRSKEMLFNQKFIGRMHYLHDVYKMRDQFDNVYHEVVDHLPNPLQKPVDRRVQTNVLEMLGIDDVKQSISQNSESEESMDFASPADKMNRRKRLSKKRIMEVPDFEFDDIQGEFEADENGKFLLIQKQGRLHDKKGRLVNRRGYLIDQIGNVVNRLGKLIFMVDELSPEDDELPDPFCYEKIRALKSHKHEVQFRVALHSQVVEDKAKLEAQNLLIEQQFEDNKNKKYSDKFNSKLQSHGDESSIQESAVNGGHQETSVREEEEMFIQKLTQPKQPKTKGQFMNAQNKKAQSQKRLVSGRSRGSDSNREPIFKAMRPPSQASVHRVEQLQEMIVMKDLQFSKDAKGRGQGSAAGRSAAKQYVPGKDIQGVYADNESKLMNQRQKVLLDQEFLGKMEQFNKQLNSKRKEFLNNSQGGRFLSSDAAASEIASQMETRGGLAHRNLHSVYGRVKQKFNQNMSTTTREAGVNAGPSATVHKRVDNRMQELEDIYMRPRVDGQQVRNPAKANESMHNAIESLDVTKQLKDIHHLKNVNTSGIHSQQFSGGQQQDTRSQHQVRERPSLNY